MSLGSKILLALVVVVVAFIGADNAVQQRLVSGTFAELERLDALKDLQRAVHAVESESRALRATSRLLATWIGGQTRSIDAWVAETFRASRPLAYLDVDAIWCFGPDGGLVFARTEERAGGREVELAELAGGGLPPDHPLLAARAAAGLWPTSRGLLLVGTHALHQGGAARESRLVLARFLDERLVERLGSEAKVRFELFPVPAARADRPPHEPLVEEAPDGEWLHARESLAGLLGEPVVELRVAHPARILERGRRAMQSSTLSTVVTALVILLVLSGLLKRIVVAPLGRLTRHAVRIGETDDTSSRMGSDSPDEIGQLAREFDRMMEAIARVRSENVRAARLAGMSEIATRALHNAGNSLNSVRVSAAEALVRLKRLPVADVERTAALLERSGDLARFVAEDPRRAAHLAPLLAELAGALGRERDRASEELVRALGALERVAAIVQDQQHHASGVAVLEPTDLGELLESALRLCIDDRAAAPEVVREVAPAPACLVDRNKLLEVLVHLIQNALRSIEDAGSGAGVLTLRASADPGRGVRLAVEDTGEGIAPDDLGRVFELGFTTRPGARGFGLHLASNAVRELEGRLEAHSAGPGHGALFEIHLPYRAPGSEPRPAPAADTDGAGSDASSGRRVA